MTQPIGIYACNRGHRYRASVLHPGAKTTCPRCDRAELIALAYGDCQKPPRGCRLLDFRTEGLSDFQECIALMKIVGPYNAFDPIRVLKGLEPIFPRLSAVEIGREGSPVLYGHVPYWTHQAIGWQGSGMGTRLSAAERSAIATEFLRAMEAAEADELSDNGYALRAWWD